MTDYYSQNGEDFILDQMFPGKIDGFFVEVGCIDGKRFSNTFHFERKGWKGMCIEAHPDYIPLLQANRPNSIICHCAVGETDHEDVIFYANKRGSLSTLDKSQEARWQRDYAPYFHGFEEKHVPMKSLGTVFRENALTHIDIFSIDIEGYETHALKGLDFSFIKPLVMVIESDSAAQESEIDTILLPQGYMKSVRVSGNIFFVLDPVYHQRVAGKVFTDVEIVHTRHPLDSGEDQSQLITITTQSEMPQYIERKSVFQRLIGTFEKIFPKVPKNQSEPKRPTPATTRFIFHKVGFHGDQHLLSIVDSLSQHVDAFVETGTNVGSTLAYFAQTYPHIPCLSCEPDAEAFQHAQGNVSGLTNITLYNQASQQFLETLREKHGDIFHKKVLFWLDAHGYGFQWPLKEELAFISGNFPQALILIDDFKVPGRDMFGYDEYDGQICSYQYVKDALDPARTYKVYYPNYTEHTSPHHPLRGWGLIEYGQEQGLRLPERIQENIYLSTPEENSSPPYGKMAVRDRLGEIKSRIMNPQPLIIDGGANLGSVTDALLGYYPSATIHAFEPIPQLADILRAKYAHRPNVIVHAKALGAEPKTLTFHQLNNIDSSSFLPPSAITKRYHGERAAISNELAVEQVRLDDMVDGEIDILKLDLQGYELEALKGAERSLPSTKLILIEVEFVPLYENQPLFGDMDIFLRERGFILLNLYELWTHPDGQLTSGDAIYLNSRYFNP